MGNSRNKHFLNIKLYTVLSSVIKSYAVPLMDVNHPLVQHIHAAYARPLGHQIDSSSIAVLAFK